MPYKSDKQRKFMHARHPEIAAKWDEEIRANKKTKKTLVSKARKDYVPKPIDQHRMDDEAMARAKTRQKWFSYTGSGLGLTGLGLLGTGAAVKGKNPQKAIKMKNYATNTSITAGGIGALSGINFARIQSEESKRAREIKKSNYGSGYSQFYVEDRKPVQRVKQDMPFTISRKAADPERSREARQKTYPYIMGGGAVATGALTAREATIDRTKKTKEKVQTKGGTKIKRFPMKDIDTKVLRSKPVRVGAGTAATAGLAYGAYYNAQKKNRDSYEGQWYRG